MKRTPLARRTPLRARPTPGPTSRQRLTGRADRRPAITERPAPAPLDLTAAAAALQHAQRAAETPRAFGGPIADPVKATRPAGDGSFSEHTRTRILMRDGYACQRCSVAPGDAYPGISLQHRVARQMGGTNRPHIALPGNGLTLCGDGTRGCHGWVERNPEDAEKRGYAVPSWADPTTVPVYTPGGWFLLDNHGRRTPCAPPPNNDARNLAVRITP